MCMTVYRYVPHLQVKRCDEMARKLRFLTDQVGMRCMAPPEHVHGLERWGVASSRASNRHISAQVHKANLTVVGRAPAWSERALTVDELEVSCGLRGR